METPRFKVTSLSGYGSEGGNAAVYATSYQVLDTAYCYDLCFETYSRRTAEAVAAEFNAGDMKAAARRYRTRALGVIREAGYRAAAKGKAG